MDWLGSYGAETGSQVWLLSPAFPSHQLRDRKGHRGRDSGVLGSAWMCQFLRAAVTSDHELHSSTQHSVSPGGQNSEIEGRFLQEALRENRVHAPLPGPAGR